MSSRGEKISGNEQTDKSKRVEVCGMFGCEENPTSQCPDCAKHYCYEHIKSHVHRTLRTRSHATRSNFSTTNDHIYSLLSEACLELIVAWGVSNQFKNIEY